MGRLTIQRGIANDGKPYITLVKRNHFPTDLQEALRKLAGYEDMEERDAECIHQKGQQDLRYHCEEDKDGHSGE